MQIINNVNSITFSHNGRNYIKNFIIIKQGSTNIAIHNSFDTRHQLVSSTHYSQFTVDGIVYGSQADLMEALSPILFSKAGVNGEITTTSQLINDGENGIHPFITANDLPQANQILNENGYLLSGETLTMYSGWVWTISNIQYMNLDDVDLSVPEASSGTTRIDIVVATSGNTFDIVQGVEVEENPVAPATPNGTLLATFIYVGDGTSETIVQPTPIGDDYLPKSDEFIAQFGSLTGSISNLGLKSYTNYIFKDTCSVTQIDSASFLNGINVYKGKRIRFTNKQTTPITFKHNNGTGLLKFNLLNENDFKLYKDETIDFILDETNSLLIQTSQINLGTDIYVNNNRIGNGSGDFDSNIVFGNQAFSSNTSGTYNVAIGQNALNKNTTGYNNSAIGAFAGVENTTGNFNLAIGTSALQNNTNSQNLAIGASALRYNTTGQRNTGIGTSALQNNIIGNFNTAIGNLSLYRSTGDNNIGIGRYAGSNITSGNGNIIFSNNSTSTTAGLSSGNNNIFIGSSVNGITSGDGNIVLGNVSSLSSALNNNIIIADGSGTQRISINDLGETLVNGYITTDGVQALEFVDKSDIDYLFVANNKMLSLGDFGNDYNGNWNRVVSFFDPEYYENGMALYSTDGSGKEINVELYEGFGRVDSWYTSDTHADLNFQDNFYLDSSGNKGVMLNNYNSSSFGSISMGMMNDNFLFRHDNGSTFNDYLRIDVTEETIKLGKDIDTKLEMNVNSNQVLMATNGLSYIRLNDHGAGNTRIGGNNLEIDNGSAIHTFDATTSTSNSLYQLIGATGKLPVIGTTAPSSSTDTGIVGELRVPNDGYLYVCVANNTWQRLALTTW